MASKYRADVYPKEKVPLAPPGTQNKAPISNMTTESQAMKVPLATMIAWSLELHP